MGVVLLTLAFTGGEPPARRSGPSNAMLVIRIMLGVALLGLAVRLRRRREAPAATRRWTDPTNEPNALAAVGVGVLLQPWPMDAAGVATVSQANVSQPSSVIALVAFCLLGSSSYLGLQAYAVLAPTDAVRLTGLRIWITARQNQIAAALSASVGLWLVVDGAFLLLP